MPSPSVDPPARPAPRRPGPCLRPLALSSAALLATACTSRAPGEGASPIDLETAAGPISVDRAARETCGTPDEIVAGLSRQLVDAINCLRPGTLVDIPLDAFIEMLEADRPNLIDGRAVADLRAAAREGNRPMVIRWAYRDVGLQQLFWLQNEYQGCAIAARPGSSNHQNGLAVDLNDWAYWEPIMRRHGWENNLDNDRVHFDYQRAPDIGLAPLSLYAFQELWNLNVPEAPLALNGTLDAETDAALAGVELDGLPRDLCDPARPEAFESTVGRASWRACDPPDGLPDGLSAQIVRSIRCLAPDALSDLPICRGAGCFSLPAGEPAVLEVDALAAAQNAGRRLGATMPLRRAFRDLATGHFEAMAAERLACDDAPAAARSVLDGALGLETVDGSADGVLGAAGFERVPDEEPRRWRGPGADRTTLHVTAFQRLWNLNHPEAPLVEDGRIGPATRAAIERAPVAGFADEPCPPDAPAEADAGETPPPPVDGGLDANPVADGPVDPPPSPFDGGGAGRDAAGHAPGDATAATEDGGRLGDDGGGTYRDVGVDGDARGGADGRRAPEVGASSDAGAPPGDDLDGALGVIPNRARAATGNGAAGCVVGGRPTPVPAGLLIAALPFLFRAPRRRRVGRRRVGPAIFRRHGDD
jgi:hypothetical protein